MEAQNTQTPQTQQQTQPAAQRDTQTSEQLAPLNIPSQQMQPSPMQPGQPMQQPSVQPVKKKRWMGWIIAIVIILIAAGLGYYFLI
jgi:hypothetical protein